jgi:ElaB/YqjD/DUF883 family membrane-anchored ribosome-binding protein
MPDSVDTTRRNLIQDFNAVIEDGEKLLKALAATGAEKGSALRASAEQNLQVARERLKELQADALERSRAAAKAADEYVHENPWESMGIVAAVAALAGFVAGLMMNRR